MPNARNRWSFFFKTMQRCITSLIQTVIFFQQSYSSFAQRKQNHFEKLNNHMTSSKIVAAISRGLSPLRWRHMCVTVSQITGNLTVCPTIRQLVSANNINGNIKAAHCWPFDGNPSVPFQWRHNGRDGDSNHQPRDYLLNRLSRRRSKKTSKLHVSILCEGNSLVTGEFPAQMASNAENVSIWCRHHAEFQWVSTDAGSGLVPNNPQSIPWSNVHQCHWRFRHHKTSKS